MISLLLTIALIGVVAYLLTAFVPMPPKMAQLIVVVAIIFALLIVASYFGVLPAGLHEHRVVS